MKNYSAGYNHNYYEYGENDTENQDSDNFCDACERGFTTRAQLNAHLQEHRVCGIDGCKFVAHSKIVEKHISMQHVSGLYYRIAQSDSPEDVAKWIAERKKRYPTKENIEKRMKEQEEMMNRGERISEPKERFGRKTKKDPMNKKGHQTKKNHFKNKKNKLLHLRKLPPKIKKLTPKDLPSISLLNNKSTWNGKIPPFQGTSDLYESDNVIEVEDDFDDSEWVTEGSIKAPKIEINNALGALIGAYRSSDESDSELNVPEPKLVTPELSERQEPEVTNKEEKNVMSEDEAPEEMKMIKAISNTHQYFEYNEKKVTLDNKTPGQNRKRKRKHSRDENCSSKKVPVNNKKNHPRNITLLEKLLAPEIKHERNLILQCVRYVVKNNFFENINKNKVSVTETINKPVKEEFISENINNIEMKEFLDCKNISDTNNIKNSAENNITGKKDDIDICEKTETISKFVKDDIHAENVNNTEIKQCLNYKNKISDIKLVTDETETISKPIYESLLAENISDIEINQSFLDDQNVSNSSNSNNSDINHIFAIKDDISMRELVVAETECVTKPVQGEILAGNISENVIKIDIKQSLEVNKNVSNTSNSNNSDKSNIIEIRKAVLDETESVSKQVEEDILIENISENINNTEVKKPLDENKNVSKSSNSYNSDKSNILAIKDDIAIRELVLDETETVSKPVDEEILVENISENLCNSEIGDKKLVNIEIMSENKLNICENVNNIQIKEFNVKANTSSIKDSVNIEVVELVKPGEKFQNIENTNCDTKANENDGTTSLE